MDKVKIVMASSVFSDADALNDLERKINEAAGKQRAMVRDIKINVVDRTTERLYIATIIFNDYYNFTFQKEAVMP